MGTHLTGDIFKGVGLSECLTEGQFDLSDERTRQTLSGETCLLDKFFCAGDCDRALALNFLCVVIFGVDRRNDYLVTGGGDNILFGKDGVEAAE